MPATFPPITNDVLAGVRAGDEKALERLFRDHYDALIDEAKTTLEEATHAPRVVETAILRAWEKHEGFETPESLASFLHSAVREGAVREKSRRAGVHRLEAHEGVKHVSRGNGAPMATVNDSWAHVAAVLHPAAQGAGHAKEVAESNRHVAAQHMARAAKHQSPLVTAAYIVAVIAAVGGMLYSVFRESPEQKAVRFLKNPESHEITSKFGQIGSMTLDDGTKASLGADSKLLIPPAFNREVRAVRVTGTGSFEVAPNATLPFEVHLGEVAVVATGTKFAVNYDTATHIALVRVDEGTVNVRFKKEVRPVATGQALEVDQTGAMKEASKASVDEALAWTRGRLVVVDRTLRQALEQTRRWYAIALTPSDMSLMERKVSIDAPLDSSKVMISNIEASGNMKFGWEDKTMVLYDIGATPKAAKKK